MDDKQNEKELEDKIDHQANEMIDDFKKHLSEVKEVIPDCDDRMIFESWAIQKIAGLQILLQEVKNENDRLRDFVTSRFN